MIRVCDAEEQIYNNLPRCHMGQSHVDQPSGDILAEPLLADRPYPPFHRVAMDGIAISHKQWLEGVKTFPIQECQRAGEPQKKLKHISHCLEVMTGAPLPTGCDCVIRIEDLEIAEGCAKLKKDLVLNLMQNVHQQGSDYSTGDLLVPEGVKLTAPRWGIAASIGKGQIKTTRLPQIAVLSTGDELVEVDQKPELHQIRKSNSYAVLSALKNCGLREVSLYHLKDNRDTLYRELGNILEQNDFTILSGGVSMGKYDFVPQVLRDLKVKQVFHKVRQKPGKPMWFGTRGEDKVVFGLPGNPVSTLVCLYRYVLPALKHFMGERKQQRPFTLLKEAITFKKALTCFAPVRIEYDQEGRTWAQPISSNGSGDFASLAMSDGFVELPEGEEFFAQGTAYPLYRWEH